MEWWGWLVLVFFLMLLLEAVICAGCHYAVHKDEEDKAAAAAAASGERDGIIHGPGRDDGYDLPSGGGGGGGGAQQQGPFAAAVKPSGVQDLGLSKYAPQRDNERGTQQPAVPLQGEGNNNAAFGNDGEYGGGGGNFQGGASPWKGAGTSHRHWGSKRQQAEESHLRARRFRRGGAPAAQRQHPVRLDDAAATWIHSGYPRSTARDPLA